MSQHDYVISNDIGSAVRADINNALGAIATVNSGATEPSTTYAYQLWMDTSSNVLKMRNSANSAWYTLPISPVANNTVDINGGTIDGATIGGSSAGAGTFTNLTATGTVTLNQSTIDGLTVGQGAGNVSTNTAVGASALSSGSLSGGNNTGIGYNSMLSNTSGTDSVAVGTFALYSNTTGASNTALGKQAVVNNTTGGSNVGVGYQALAANTTASYNTAVGYQALYANTTGQYNTAVGYQAGTSLTSSNGRSTFVGWSAGSAFTTGDHNTCIGQGSGQSGTSGTYNTYIGRASGELITTGSKNTILGGYNGNQNGLDIRTSSNNIVLSDGDGNPRLVVGSNGNIAVGHTSTAADAKFVSRGTGSYAVVASDPAYSMLCYNEGDANNTSDALFIGRGGTDYSGFGGTNRIIIYSNGNIVNQNNSYGSISDEKLKENIVDSGSQWDDIKALRVRKYSLIEEASDKPTKLGVIAQEVEASGMGGLVFESPDRDADNNDLGTVTKQVNYSVLYMKAVKALQEAMERIETLEAKVAALETP